MTCMSFGSPKNTFHQRLANPCRPTFYADHSESVATLSLADLTARSKSASRTCR